MNCLHSDPKSLIKKIDPIRRDFKYTCLDVLQEYNILINIYYSYFLSIEEFRLKNIWNHLVQKWTTMQKELYNDKEFKESEYYNEHYVKIHSNMRDIEFDNLLNNFIDSSHLKALFLCNIIQNYIYPK